VKEAARRLAVAWGTDLIAPESCLGPMACVRLPGPRVPSDGHEANKIQDMLYFKYAIEVPIKMLKNRLYVRISAHIYNTVDEFEILEKAMLEIRPKFLTEEEDVADATAAETAEIVQAATSCG